MEEVKTPPSSIVPQIGEELNFHHIDGMYSYCLRDDGTVVHIAAWSEVEVIEPGPDVPRETYEHQVMQSIPVSVYKQIIQQGVLPPWWHDIDGWLSVPEATVLGYLATNVHKNTGIIEIGTYRGRATLALACGAGVNPARPQIYTFDHHQDTTLDSDVKYGWQDKIECYANMADAPVIVSQLIHLVCLPHQMIAPQWPAHTVGLIFIDGDHQANSIMGDFHAWCHALVDGAFVALHDTNWAVVQAAVQALVDQHKGQLTYELVGQGMTILRWHVITEQSRPPDPLLALLSIDGEQPKKEEDEHNGTMEASGGV